MGSGGLYRVSIAAACLCQVTGTPGQAVMAPYSDDHRGRAPLWIVLSLCHYVTVASDLIKDSEFAENVVPRAYEINPSLYSLGNGYSLRAQSFYLLNQNPQKRDILLFFPSEGLSDEMLTRETQRAWRTSPQFSVGDFLWFSGRFQVTISRDTRVVCA